MKYVERRSLGEIEETCGGGMKRSRIHSNKEGSI